jgi:hypothetical protein
LETIQEPVIRFLARNFLPLELIDRFAKQRSVIGKRLAQTLLSGAMLRQPGFVGCDRRTASVGVTGRSGVRVSRNRTQLFIRAFMFIPAFFFQSDTPLFISL